MGFSLISLAEVLFHSSMGLWKRRKLICSRLICPNDESDSCLDDWCQDEKNEQMKQEENRDYDWPNATDHSDSDEDDYPNENDERPLEPENHASSTFSLTLCPVHLLPTSKLESAVC